MLWLLIGFIVGILVLFYFLFYLLGINKIFYSFVKEGEIEFILSGETLHRIIPNLRRHRLKKAEVEVKMVDNDGKIIPSNEKIFAERFFPLKKEEEDLRKNFLGLYWIGFPPYRKILEYTFSWDKLITEAGKKEEEDKGRTVEYSGIGDLWFAHRSEDVSSLYLRYTYPIVVKGVELAGRITVDIAFNVMVEVVVPIIPIFYLKGKWFPPFAATFKGIISDRLRGIELNVFEDLDKGKELNLAIFEKNELLISTTGMKSSQTSYIDYTIAGSAEEKKAATAEKIAQFNARAKIEEAKGEKTATIEIAMGKAESTRLDGVAKSGKLKELMQTANEYEQGAEVLKHQIFAEALTETEVSVLSLGQNNPLQFAVNAEGKRKKKVYRNKTIDTTKELTEESEEKGGE